MVLLSVCVYSKRSVDHQYCETTDTHLSFYCKSYSSYYTAHTTSHVFLCLVKDPPPAEVKLLTPGVAEAGRAATSVTLIPYLVVLPNVVLLLASGKRDHLLNYTFDLQGFWAACVPDSTKYLAFISKYCGNEKH